MNPQLLKQLELGYSHQMNGDLARAETLYLDIIKSDADSIHALNLLGMLYVNSDRAAQAQTYLTRAIKINPTDPQTQNNYGLSLKDSKDFEAASRAFEAAIKLDPQNPIYRNNLGSVFSDQFNPDKAIPCFIEALKLLPDYPECLSNLSYAFNQINRTGDAIAAARQALKFNPDYAEAHNHLADALMKHCAYEDAIRHYNQAYALEKNYHDALINKSVAEKDAGLLKESRRTLDDLMQRVPDYPRVYYVFGLLMEQLGHQNRAVKAYEKAVNLNPEYGAAYYQLSQIKDYQLSTDEETKIQSWFDNATCSREQKKYAAFTLARIHEARKAYTKSLSYLKAGHEAILGNAQYNDSLTNTWYGQIKHVFAERKPKQSVEQQDEPRPLFIVAMPRSGTSLTEQILTSHSMISGGGESSFLEDTVGAASRITGEKFPQCIALLNATQKQELGQIYLNRLVQKGTHSQYVIDKTPYNFQYLGFINEILPHAKIIHCYRDPLDNCLSIYRHPFDLSQTYAHNQRSLGQFYLQYKKLMGIWGEYFGDKLLHVGYENVVSGLEEQAHLMLNYLGLPFEDSVLNYHHSKAIVRTPSAGQVRQPIYKDSVAYWQRYGEGLSELQTALKQSC
jgi:tetratricopeptide (TPR) repeat protein